MPKSGMAVLLLLPVLAAGADLELPFEFLHKQIVLQVEFNGSGPYNFVVDTGTHASTIDLGLAKRLRIPLAAVRSEGRGAGGSRVFGSAAVLEDLRAGELRVARLPVVALDLSAISEQLGRPLGGVLGHNFLASRITQIDYFRRRIRLLADSPHKDAASRADSATRTSFPMQFRSNSVLPVLEDFYVNEKKLTVTLDTGSSLGLILFPRTIRQLGLDELARSGIPMEAAGYRGKAKLTKGWVRSVVLKSIDLGAIEVAYVRRGYEDDEDPARRGGNLGNAVLQDFILTLDYQNGVVVLESTAN
ncbi:MAG: retropepsin-like aspartic protease [Bryobacteraceae bacterium]